MEYTTVYEVLNEPLHLGWLLPVLAFCAFTGFIIYNLSSNWKVSTKKMRIWQFVIIVIGLTFIFSIVTPPIYDYINVNQKYKNDNYSTVQGKIENFHSMPASGHDHESFTLNGIYFEYSDFNEGYHGFNNAASFGGPLTHNGQEVRLGYITHVYERRTEDFETNVIMKIELME